MDRRHDFACLIPALILAVVAVIGCSTQRKMADLHKYHTGAQLNLSDELTEAEKATTRKVMRDTLKVVDDDGTELFIMKAIKDDESGEMVANEVLDAAVVTARFRNISEHHGKIDLAFQVTVPQSMRDSKWQLRFYPDMFILDDSLRLDPVNITGDAYRKSQLRGYQQYERFLAKIITDSTMFVDRRSLDIFIRRNMPELYRYKNDTTLVSDEQFYSEYGLSESDVIEHYTNSAAKNLNDRRKSMIYKKFKQYVKAPIVTEGIRLDTIVVNTNGDFTYNYVQTINTRPRLKKVDIVLSGDIWESDKKLYDIPRTQPLTFYISSVSAFADGTERYLQKVIERKAEANTACYVDFAVGKSDIDMSLGHNEEEIGRIKHNLAELMRNTTFDLDSIVVDASASPEGKVAANAKLAKARSASISKYLNNYIQAYQDSLSFEEGMMIDENGRVSYRKKVNIPFISRSSGENWDMLDFLVLRDTVLTEGQKSAYSTYMNIKDLDAREAMLQKEPSYKYMRSTLYPRLRTVKFNFYLHRKGMVKDTIHTTVLDSVYMAGVQALKDMDYNFAIKYLRPYNDFNTAVACVATDLNLTAKSILEGLEKTAEVNYLLAIVYARLDDPQQAVQCYMKSCKQNGSFVFRGNLDPEISHLIKTYGLNQEDDSEYLDL